MAKTPVSWRDGLAHRFLQGDLVAVPRCFSTRWAMTSVSVSVVNLWPSAMSCFFRRDVVFDDAVVHHDDLAGAVAVRMGVLFGGAAVGGPAGVADAVGAIERLQADRLFQVAQLAFGAAHLQSFTVAGDGDSRRVVAAVFQATQAVDDDGHDAFLANVSNDSAHSWSPSQPFQAEHNNANRWLATK